jgi:RNA processing factor Prp31
MLNFMVVGQDTIIMHAIGFLNDFDKKLNMYVLKV